MEPPNWHFGKSVYSKCAQPLPVTIYFSVKEADWYFSAGKSGKVSSSEAIHVAMFIYQIW